MIRVHEKRIFKLFLIFQIIGLFLTIGLSIYALIDAFNNNIFKNIIFEIIYLAIHFIIQFFIICLYFIAIKENSNVFKSLKNNFNKKALNIIAYILIAISLFLLIYFSLVLFNLNLYYFNFPKILNIEILLAAYLVLITSLTGVFYLIESSKDDYLFDNIKKGNTL